MKEESYSAHDDPNRMPPAQTGNASNPSPEGNELEPIPNQLIDERGEKYIREVASIEDYPDPEDDKAMDEALSKEKE